LDDRGRDGGTNFILRIKGQETRLTLQEHDDDDDDDYEMYVARDFVLNFHGVFLLLIVFKCPPQSKDCSLLTQMFIMFY